MSAVSAAMSSSKDLRRRLRSWGSSLLGVIPARRAGHGIFRQTDVLLPRMRGVGR